jgi:hypothetical protein
VIIRDEGQILDVSDGDTNDTNNGMLEYNDDGTAYTDDD